MSIICVNFFTKYDWVKPLKEQKGKTGLNAFAKMENKSNRIPTKLLVD